MSDRIRWAIVASVAAVAVLVTAVVGFASWRQYQDRASAPSTVDVSAHTPTGERIVFRNTASGEGYGHVASVRLTDPSGERFVDSHVCDRVDASADFLSCLRAERGVVPSYSATVYDASGDTEGQWPLPGIPSRTRLSPDGNLVATTAFVTGHSYATMGFSTETVIHDRGGADFGNLESWTLLVDGVPSAPSDRNFWGVTFVDDKTFYATVGMTSAGQTYLVHGDIPTRTLTTVAGNVECPSLSPDGTRIAFKRVTPGGGPSVHWTPAIFTIATGEVTELPEPRTIDDQIEWLGDDTILYGMPRTDAVGDSDVWSLAADGSADPELFIEHAWSPSVVRPPG